MITSLLWMCLAAPQDEPAETIRFRKVHLTAQYWAEGASAGDLNGDGHVDIVCGQHWYPGPNFRNMSRRHELDTPIPANKRSPFDNQVYTNDHFFSWVHDISGDGRPDVLVVGLTGKPACWYENPGRYPGKRQVIHWKKHEIIPKVYLETTIFENVLGDETPELVCVTGNRLGYATPDPEDVRKPWIFHPVSPEKKWRDWVRTAHSLGVGDVDGDGRKDILRKDGWWCQPESLEGDPEWSFHPFNFANRGGAEMYAYDVNGDGLNDIITSLNAHGWGLSWFEQVRDSEGNISFKERPILGKTAEEKANRFGVQFSQLHALVLADIDGDGLKDIVTGKTWRAHDFGDPGSRMPAVLYWFRLTRREGKAEFVPHLIDRDSGIGRRFEAVDVNGDGRLDLVIGSKKGTFLFLQQK